ncbi:ABC transporter ATP-binding protein [Salisaeta longa]|uniref:ABC transporter ATP-binding protein n=1 Tax=Salisaeta longa TaxID=503170 RepID=UPI0003B5BA10|nr:ABC transporter ATP-binding protein [Salisaeta longa]
MDEDRMDDARPALSVRDLSVVLGGTTIVDEASFTLPTGTWTSLVGPNGCGKTTIVRAITGVLPHRGTVHAHGEPLASLSDRARAQQMAVVQQAPRLAFDFTVRELVQMGQLPHSGWLSMSRGDAERLDDALARVDLQGYDDRSVHTLSGGELQRAFLAQAFVQNPKLFVLDEPTAHLDVHYQYALLRQVRALVDGGRTVLAIVHDLERAAHFADSMLVMKAGRIVAHGAPADVLTPACIAEVFRMRASVDAAPDGQLRITYHDALPAQETRATR